MIVMMCLFRSILAMKPGLRPKLSLSSAHAIDQGAAPRFFMPEPNNAKPKPGFLS